MIVRRLVTSMAVVPLTHQQYSCNHHVILDSNNIMMVLIVVVVVVVVVVVEVVVVVMLIPVTLTNASVSHPLPL